MFTCRPDRFNSGVLFHRLFMLISTFCSRIAMSLRRIDSLKRFIDRIHNWAHTPQPSQSNAKNNSNNENSCERSNISGNSTTRPPEGEEHGVATVTATATATATAHSPDSCANNGKNNNEGNEEHLAEVLVLPVDDTKTIATTTTTMIEAPTVEVAANTSARTADIERGNACVVGGRNSCGKASLANEANTTARRGSATAPIAREEEDAEEVWTSESEDGKDVELAGKQAVAQNCCLVNEIEKGGGQFDTNSYINSNKMPAVSATLAVTVTLTSTTVTEAGTAEKSVQRSKSRVRTYLKKCRDRLTGQHQHSAATAAHSTMSEPNGTQGIQATANSAMHLKDEKSKATAVAEVLKAAPKRNSSQSHVLEEDEGEREEKEETPCTCALIATIEWQDDELARTLLPLSEESEDERTAAEEAEAEEEAHSTSELTELVYEDIDFSLTSVLMDSSSSNVSVDQHQSTPLTSVHNRDALTLSAAAAAADVDDSDDLAVEGETRRRQIIEEKEEKEESCQQQPRQMLMPNYNSCPPLVKEAQLAHAIRMDSGTAELIDKHLAAIYPVYMACTRAILIRQARDLLVSSYSACLQSFEMKFLCKFAEIAADLSQRHAIGENVLWRKGWPLTTPTGEVVLHLGSLDNALVRPGDLYLCVKSANKTETPQLFAVWRSAPSDIVQLQQKQQPLHASATGTLTATETADASKIHSYCIDFSATPAPTATTPPTHLSALTLEMLTSDELPQLLQQLLVGVEHSIERVSLNELQMTATTTTTTTTATTAMPLAADVANNNNNGNKININSMLVRCNNSSNSNNNNNNTITNSPKCALRRSELITKNKVLNNKFMLRRLTNRQDSMNSTSSGQSCGSSGSTSSDELLRCNTNSSSTITTTNHNSNHLSAGGSGNGMLVSGNNGCSSLEPLKMSAGSTNSASTSPALPLFCLGNSFPHIDSDEENADEKRSANGEDQFECEIVPPASIGEIPEKLLTTSGIYLPGTSDLKGHPIVTVDAECVLAAGLNCYEIATVLLYYSTIPERISTVNANDRTTLHQQQQPSMQLQQPQQNHQHQSQQPQQSSISRLSTPKTVKEVATSAAQPAAAGTTTTTTTTMPVTSNVTTATAVKSPAHANATTIDNTNTNTNTNSNSNSGSNAATPTFTILIAIEKPSQMCVIDLIYQSLRLLTRQIAYCEILAVCLERNLLQQQQQLQQQPNATTFNNNVAISMVGNGENNNESCIKVTSWITSDGNDTLQRFANLQFDCETAIKEQEQEFEKYYFISMKHLAKGRDLYDAAINVEALHDSAVNLKSALDCFAEKLESARERIEAASRLQHLLTVHNLEPHVQQEMQRLAEVTGATLLLEKYRQQQQQQLGQEENSNIEQSTTETTENVSRQVVCSDAPTNNNKPNSLNLSNSRHSSNLSKQQQLPQQLQHVAVITSTPVPRMNRLSHRSSSGIGSFDGQTCQCWRESRNMEDMDEMLDVDGEELELEDGEEEQSKIADSGVGGCERCEGNPKLTRVCSCQSLNEAANLYGKSHNSDELDFECYERPVKRYNDIHSPMEANAHLQYHASSLELSKLEELSCLDPKIQKTLLLIMREMIGTERDYVHSLNYVIENYVDELLREDIPQPLRGQRNVIFGNIEKIFEFHKWHFLNELERYERNPLKIGSAFLEMESKFYLYALYNKNKPKSDTLMSEYGTAFFKSKQFELNDKMDLASYLLKPVQRMGKYALLLQQLVKACNAVEGAALQEIAADVEELQRAEEMVKFQLRHGNDLLAMDSLRDCDVNVKEQGRLLRQNEFLVWQGRGGKKSLRQIFLFEDLVLFSKARRFPDQKNLDIYIYKNSIKTSDIGLTAHVGDSKTKFEIWFRKRKPDDTWTMQCMSEDIKNAWTEEISKLLWKQANRNREIRLAEMSSMGIGSKPCLDIRPSNNQINDRSITISQLGKAPKLRHSFAGLHLDGTKNARRPNSLISESSLSSGTSSSSLSTGSSSGHERVGGGSTSSSGGGGGGGCHGKSAAGTISSHHALELINETQTLMLSGGGGGNVAAATSNGGSGANTNTLSSSGSSGRSGRSGHSGRGGSGVNGGGLNGGANNGTTTRSKRSTTLVSQLSMESGILSDISMTPDQEHSDATCSWLNANTVAASASLTIATNLSSPTATSTTATIGCGGGDGGGANSTTVIMRRQRLHHSKQQQQEKHEKHKELQHQQSAPAALQERSSIGGQCNPYLREFKADSVNL
ncbi:PREDICTED: uncharacterized protein LOC108377030 isoform X3 [Rhagoletis zephyria]|uniref:uncharacterized protein LOC108377030 isoform X3 n=1 Tax=Rhagoletis zephyria TaxID=28612 RepID=UPI0008115C6D|nr:PREDICTED: uncharacterized protein LOC108377030 isoform X3 [Rhagoletis zephyria]